MIQATPLIRSLSRPSLSLASTTLGSNMAALAAFKGALGRPIAIGGHRGMGEDLLSIEGASQTVYPAYRENTVLSLQQAASLRGVSFVEFDVQVTRDGVPVIWHDDDVVYGDPASPRSVAVKDLDLQEFQALVQPTAAESAAAAANNNINNGAAAAATTNDAADDGKQQLRRRRGTGWRSSLLRAFRSRETRQPVAGYSRWACREDDVLPTLEELFRNLPPQVGFDVEVKMTTGPEVVVTDAAEISRMLDAVISTVERCAAQDASPRPIFYSSFDPDVCKELRRRQSRYGVRFLSGCGLYPHADPRRTSIPSALQFAHENGLHGVVLPASILVANPRMAQEAAAMGLDLMTYGLENNDLDKIMQQCDLGVSAAIVDDVQAVAAAMEAASAASSA